jgi:FKBP-type peptidyl-prolyl cis-trans isomerase
MPIKLVIIALLATTLSGGESQQINITPPRSETTIRSLALDKDGQLSPDGQQVLAQMSSEGWRPGSMTALSPTLVAILFSRSLPQAKPPAPSTQPAAVTTPQSETAVAQALVAAAASPTLQGTASGLRYAVVRPGSGRKPGPTDQVTVRYTGAKLDGTVFDASSRHGGTAQFGVNQVIKGWTEGLQLMQEGAIYHFVIPADLAYGKQGPPSIGPDQTLLFEVELLSVR